MYVPREIEGQVQKWMDEKEIIGILGPRQCGKTTMVKHLIDEMVSNDQLSESSATYLSLDDEMVRSRFMEDPMGFMESLLLHDEKKHLLILDEVQNLPNAGPVLKVLFDRYYEKVKFIITGSSGLDVRNIGGSLVGRVVFFEMFPFSFSEFLVAKMSKRDRYYHKNRIDVGKGDLIDGPLLIDDLNDLLIEYMVYGGYPRIVLMDDLEKKEVLLTQLVTLLIEKDVLKVYGQAYRNDALRVMKYLAHNCCHLINNDDVSSHLGIDINKVKRTMDIMVYIHAIKLVRPYFTTLSTELRKQPKVCFIDGGFRNVLAEDMVFSRDKGFMLENHVFTQLARSSKKVNYWRTKGKAEVDFVSDGVPVEVKAGGKRTRSLMSFIRAYQPEVAYLVDYDVAKVEDVEGTKVVNVPACLL